MQQELNTHSTRSGHALNSTSSRLKVLLNFEWGPKRSTFSPKLNILRKAAASVLINTHKALPIRCCYSLIGCFRVHLSTSSLSPVAGSYTWLKMPSGPFRAGRRKAQSLCASHLERRNFVGLGDFRQLPLSLSSSLQSAVLWNLELYKYIQLIHSIWNSELLEYIYFYCLVLRTL